MIHNDLLQILEEVHKMHVTNPHVNPNTRNSIDEFAKFQIVRALHNKKTCFQLLRYKVQKYPHVYPPRKSKITRRNFIH